SSSRTLAYVVRNVRRRVVQVARRASPIGAFGPCAQTWRLDFSNLRAPGEYFVEVDGARSPSVRIGENVYTGGADTLLAYLRQQRSGFNPFFRDSVHRRDGYVIDDSGK